MLKIGRSPKAIKRHTNDPRLGPVDQTIVRLTNQAALSKIPILTSKTVSPAKCLVVRACLDVQRERERER